MPAVRLEEKRKEGDLVRRKEGLLGILDFAARHGEWKSENFKHRGKDGYCREWS